MTFSTLTMAQAAVAAEPGEPRFLSSFESGDDVPLVSTPLAGTPPVNIAGIRYDSGSLLGSVAEVTASAENPPGEIAANLIDGSASTKWLAFAPTATITYELEAPAVVAAYTLTSANDAATRDPLEWTVSGSVDGEEWEVIDEQSDQAFSGRGVTNAYEVVSDAETPTEYGFYRLEITANSGAASTQLAGWDIQDGSDDAPAPGPMTTVVGNGPTSGYNMKSGAGYSGLAALRYGGSHLGDGDASATNVIYQDVEIPINEGDELSYKIFPVLDDALTYSATYTAVDLLLDNGQRMSAAELVDGNRFGANARAQGEQKALYGSQWNSVRVDLSPLAGRTIESVLLSYDNPDGNASVSFSGWLDDVQVGAAAAAPADGNWVEHVDTRRGTQSSGGFSRGNNIPATAVPNGFNFFTPMTDANSQSWLYKWSEQNNSQNLPQLQGIGISHEPSPWMGDRNQLAVMPSTSATPSGTLTDRALAFDHNNEVAQPDFYGVQFENGLKAEVTPTDHAGVYRFEFPEGTDTGSVLLDSVGGTASLTLDGTSVSGFAEGGSGLSVGRSRMFVYGEFDRAPENTATASGDRPNARYAAFDTSTDKTLELRIATSFISLEQAQKNLGLEAAAARSFDDVRTDAQQQWNERLGVIEVEGATPAELTTLYSNLYRLNLYPNSQFENPGTAEAPKYQYASPVAPMTGQPTATQTNAEIVDGKIYVNNGFWDTYRTVWPAYSLLYPDVAEELVDGFVQHYRDGGWVARWSSPGYADLMTGTSSDVAFAEAYINGALDTDTALDAYDAALKNATVLPTSSGVGRKGLDRSIFLGYTPEETHESVSWGLEGLINDYGIGRMAAMLADDPATPADRVAQLEEESEYFLVRATQYGNLFDESVGFFQPRHADGTWASSPEEFDPEEWGNGFTETNGWNFAFHAPFDIDGLAALYGGTDGLIEKLDEFFATPELGNKPGSYGGVIHEILEARDVRMGQLGMSNQVSHHIPYLYAGAGKPSKSQEAVREIMQRLFVGGDIGQGYAGDEDNGETSAWWVLSSLGIYPLALGSGEYTIGSPLFTKATVKLGNGEQLVVEAPENSTENIYVQSVSFNGEPVDQATISSRLLTEGGTLSFEMGSEPSAWGERTSTEEKRTPLVDATKPGYGDVTVDDGTASGALVDDNSRSAVTFESATPTIAYESVSGPVSVQSYTLTNGAEGDTPTAWTLEASADGETWVTLDERSDEEFRWDTQTRPFELTAEERGSYPHYRLVVTATTNGGAPTLSEIELLADPEVAPSDFALSPAKDVTGTVGTEVTATLATLAGGVSEDAADYTATVDFLDGDGAVPAVLTRTQLGAWAVSAPRTFDTAATYTARITVTEGAQQATTTTDIAISRDQSLVGSFDSVCIGSIGFGGSCDVNGYTFLRDSLAEDGFVQGTTMEVDGTDLTFDLPDIEPGQPDNATGRGQTMVVDLGEGATQLSVIGTATQRNQETEGTLNFSDGTSQPLAIDFGDWTGAAQTPFKDNIILARSQGRLSGDTTVAGGVPAIFSTAPVAIPDGKTVESITLPLQTGSHQAEGRIHVFAIASDGERAEAEPLAVEALAVADQLVGEQFETELATATGGSGEYTATVNWGDATALTEATAEVTEAGATLSGGHVYDAAGDYTVTVTVDDGVRSLATTTTVSVGEEAGFEPTLTAPTAAVEPGAEVGLTGAGFAPDESVEIVLSSDPQVVVDAQTDGAGAFTATVAVPEDAADGMYPVTATGAQSLVPARAEINVVAVTPEPTMPTVQLSTDSARPGDAITVSGTGYASGEEVTVTFNSEPVLLGTFAVNADGVFSVTVEIPEDATLGEHTIVVEGLSSGATASAAISIVEQVTPGEGTGPAAPGGYEGILGNTGTEGVPALGGFALALLLLGAVGVGIGVLRRRRIRAADTTV
ncbi:MAG: GH92 family glycosyl hydrolase [Microbacteriaceae bacterium]